MSREFFFSLLYIGVQNCGVCFKNVLVHDDVEEEEEEENK